MEASPWTWFSCRRICFVSESISSVAYELKENGIQWETKNEPKKAKFNNESLTFCCSLISMPSSVFPSSFA